MILVDALIAAWFWFAALVWWIEVLIVAAFGYGIFATWRIVAESKGELQRIGIGIRESFFPKKRKYFVFYDIFRMVFFFPAIVIAVFIMLLRAGALEFIPFFKRIFGFKLFKIRNTIDDFLPGSFATVKWQGKIVTVRIVGGVPAGKDFKYMLPDEKTEVGGRFNWNEDRVLVYKYGLHEKYDYALFDPEDLRKMEVQV